MQFILFFFIFGRRPRLICDQVKTVLGKLVWLVDVLVVKCRLLLQGNLFLFVYNFGMVRAIRVVCVMEIENKIMGTDTIYGEIGAQWGQRLRGVHWSQHNDDFHTTPIPKDHEIDFTRPSIPCGQLQSNKNYQILVRESYDFDKLATSEYLSNFSAVWEKIKA